MDNVIQSLQLTPAKAFQIHTYRVPSYQREYVWEQENVEALLDDISEQIERDKNSHYFIGMVLVAPATDNTHDVIDGQQRLTTLFLLMVAMQQRALEMQDAATSDAIRGMITRVAFDTGAAVSTPKLTPFYEHGEDTFQAILANSSSIDAIRTALHQKGIPPAGSAERLVGAYETIVGYLNNHFPEKKDVQGLLAFLMSKVVFIQIATDVGQALKMFETINERGVNLNAMDLLKNLLFVQVQPSQYDKLKSKWESITKPLDKAGLKPLRFLRYFIMSRYPTADVVREDEIYLWFKDPANAAQVAYETKPMEFVNDLALAATQYVNFNATCRPDGTACPDLERLREMAGSAFSLHYVILLAAGAFTPPVFDHIVRQLEAYLFYVLYTSTLSKELERLYGVQAVKLRAIAAIPGIDAQIAAIDQFVAQEWRSFMDEKARALEVALTSYANGTTQRKFRTKYLLARLSQVADAAYQGVPAEGGLGAYKKMEIEHILPNTPNSGYDAIWDANPENGSRSYADAKESLGNLTLLEKPINIVASNDFYDKKRPLYEKSKCYLTSTISRIEEVGKNSSVTRFNTHVAAYDAWNAASITDRQRKLTDLAKLVWTTRPYGTSVELSD